MNSSPPFLNGPQRSVNRKVQDSNPCPGAKSDLESWGFGACAIALSHPIGGQKLALEVEGVGVDVYPVYQSRLGRRLQIPVEVLINHTEKIDQTRVLTAEAQFVAKMAALLDRPDTLPGEKDGREMWELIDSGQGLDFKAVAGILLQGGWKGTSRLSTPSAALDQLPRGAPPRGAPLCRPRRRRGGDSRVDSLADGHTLSLRADRRPPARSCHSKPDSHRARGHHSSDQLAPPAFLEARR